MSFFGKRRHDEVRIVVSGTVRQLKNLRVGDVFIHEGSTYKRWLVNDPGWTRIGIEPLQLVATSSFDRPSLGRC